MPLRVARTAFISAGFCPNQKPEPMHDESDDNSAGRQNRQYLTERKIAFVNVLTERESLINKLAGHDSNNIGKMEQVLKKLVDSFVSDQSGAIDMKYALIAVLFSFASFILLASVSSTPMDTSLAP